MARQNPSESVKRELEHYYGGKRCVVTKNDACEYHHIDDDDSNTSFVNLVPLKSTFNSPKLRDARKKQKKSEPVVLSSDLDPEALIHRANWHFARWDIALAYGCARLAFFIGMNYLDMNTESRLPYSCAAMYFARHSCNYDLIRDILKRDFMPIAQSGQVSSGMRTLIIQELAGIYSENGKYKESLRLYQLIPDSIATATSEMTAGKFSALLRRKATSIIAEQGSTARSDSLLKDAVDTNPHSENLTASIANTLAWNCLSNRDYRNAMDFLEPIHERYVSKIFTADDYIEPIAITAWNAAEVFHSYGVAASHLGKKYQTKSDKALAHASQIYRQCGASPITLRPGFWDSEKQIHTGARQRGVASIDFRPQLPADIDKLIDTITNWLTRQ
jgi:hypothetical protein